MLLLVAISTLIIACCVSTRRKKEEKHERTRPDAVISKSYRPSGEWIGYGARMDSSIAGGGGGRVRMESRPLRNLSAESDVSRSMVGTQSNSISDDICNSSRS
uniref:Secreted protein n=1 Tax=Panagrolaimus superbus TaxID=310955 RepID=A0A914YUE5_9BILA